MVGETNTQETQVRAVLLDLAGVLYEGAQPIEGAVAAVARLRQAGYVLRFVTNTATQSREQILKNLQAMGFSLHADELFTAPDAACAYIRARHLRPYALVHPHIQSMFEPTADRPNCVIIGDAREALNYANLNRAFRLVHDGCPLIAIGDNKYYRDGGQLSLDAGPFVRAVAWAADVQPVVMGKPSKDFFEQVVASTGFASEQCMMIGDDVLGDVQGAQQAGLQARLVATGKYQPGDEAQANPAAVVLGGIADVMR